MIPDTTDVLAGGCFGAVGALGAAAANRVLRRGAARLAAMASAKA